MEQRVYAPSTAHFVGDVPLEDDVVDHVARVRGVAELEMSELVVDGEHLCERQSIKQ